MEGTHRDLGNGFADYKETGAHEKGKQEGIDIGKQEVAEALRKKGMSEAEIAEVTGLPEKKETLK